MSTINDGGPAFPRHAYDGHDGMTLRDYFASQATDADIADIQHGTKFTRERARYIHADRMLWEREVKP
jgi:hypothetical protein